MRRLERAEEKDLLNKPKEERQREKYHGKQWDEWRQEMKSRPLDLTLRQWLATLIEGGFSEMVQAEITEPMEEEKENRRLLEG